MGDALIAILPYAFAALLAAPMMAVVTAFILAQSSRPILSSWVYTAGAAFVVAIASTVILVAFWGTNPDDESSDIGAYVDTGLGAIFLTLGILAVFGNETPEKDAARRSRMKGIASARLPRLFVVGILAQVINFDALTAFESGMKGIISAGISPLQAAFVVLIGTAVMLFPYYGPALLYQISPTKTTEKLTPMTEWLMSHSKQLEVAVGIGFGVIFLVKGIGALA